MSPRCTTLRMIEALRLSYQLSAMAGRRAKNSNLWSTPGFLDRANIDQALIQVSPVHARED